MSLSRASLVASPIVQWHGSPGTARLKWSSETVSVTSGFLVRILTRTATPRHLFPSSSDLLWRSQASGCCVALNLPHDHVDWLSLDENYIFPALVQVFACSCPVDLQPTQLILCLRAAEPRQPISPGVIVIVLRAQLTEGGTVSQARVGCLCTNVQVVFVVREHIVVFQDPGTELVSAYLGGIPGCGNDTRDRPAVISTVHGALVDKPGEDS